MKGTQAAIMKQGRPQQRGYLLGQSSTESFFCRPEADSQFVM